MSAISFVASKGPKIILVLVLIILATIALIALDTVLGLSSKTQHMTPSEQDQLEKLVEELAIALARENYVDAERIAEQIEELSTKIAKNLEGYKARVICAWCLTVLGNTDAPEDTHTICAECKANYDLDD